MNDFFCCVRKKWSKDLCVDRMHGQYQKFDLKQNKPRKKPQSPQKKKKYRLGRYMDNVHVHVSHSHSTHSTHIYFLSHTHTLLTFTAHISTRHITHTHSTRSHTHPIPRLQLQKAGVLSQVTKLFLCSASWDCLHFRIFCSRCEPSFYDFNWGRTAQLCGQRRPVPSWCRRILPPRA